jgi:Flp pilus assembly pilin Flp
MGSLIAGAVIAAVVLLGGKVEDSYTNSSTAISEAIGG